MALRGGAAAMFCVALAQASPSMASGDIALGEYLSATCVGCHQKSGQVTAGVPSIIGWPAEQFVAVMQDYKGGHRENQVMRSIAGALSQDDIAALAAYFGSLPPQN